MKKAFSNQEVNLETPLRDGGATASEISQAMESSFEYTGEAALTVIGSVSGKRYRFGKPGARLLIDLLDASDMKRLPVLRKLN